MIERKADEDKYQKLCLHLLQRNLSLLEEDIGCGQSVYLIDERKKKHCERKT